MDYLVSYSVQHCGNIGLIISLEESVEERVKRMVSSRLGISLKSMRFKTTVVQPEQVVNLFKNTFHNKLYIFDRKDVLTPDDAVTLINDIRPDIVVVDYIQNFAMKDMVTGYINAILDLETAAVRNNCHINIVSQVSDKKIYGREERAPTASDAQWTSKLYQSSSEMLSLYYHHAFSHGTFDNELLELHILACKFSDSVGKIKLQIDPDKALIIGEIP